MRVARRARGTDGGTAAKILDVAERLVQVRGFNGFSYADVAAELEITKASLHYHFAGKAELGEALIERYAPGSPKRSTRSIRKAIDARAEAPRHTRSSISTCSATAGCACAACSQPITRRSRSRCETAVVRFFDDNEAWVGGVLEQGRTEGTLHFTGSAE